VTSFGARGIVRARGLLLAVLAVFALGGIPAQAHAVGLTRAFTDDIFGDPSEAGWLPRTAATGVRLALIPTYWAAMEPNPPAGGQNPTDPGGPQYNFAALDGTVRDFASAGIQVALLVTDAPSWAEAPGGPQYYEAAGGWEPNATAFGQLGTALAKRYSGSYPDPLHPGRSLPRVKYFQAWAEANFSVHLAPQWTKSGGTWVNTGAQIYDSMLNAFYAGVKSVHGDNFVVTTGFGPYGDLGPGPCTGPNAPQVGPGCRTHPALFARNMVCLQGQSLRKTSCPNPAHFDAMAIDPYEVGGPTTHAVNEDDVSVPDMGKLTRILSKSVRTGGALPHTHKQLWVTEFGYDSNPPNVKAPTSPAGQARWMDQALYLFWKQGVSVAVWYLVRDQAATYVQGDYYTGVYFYNGAPKPALEAYRFPFVVRPPGGSGVVWGIAPRSGSLSVQRKQGRAWKTLFRIRVGAGSVFVHSISSRLHGSFRGLVGDEASRPWSG
jgi:hypothetical protein